MRFFVQLFIFVSSAGGKEETTGSTQDLASRVRDLDDNAAQSEVQQSVCKAISEVMGTKPDYDIHILLTTFHSHI